MNNLYLIHINPAGSAALNILDKHLVPLLQPGAAHRAHRQQQVHRGGRLLFVHNLCLDVYTGNIRMPLSKWALANIIQRLAIIWTPKNKTKYTADSAYIFLIILLISLNKWSGWSGRRRRSCLVWSLLERQPG